MNKDILKKTLFSLVLAVMLSACEYDDSALNDRMDALEERIENLEKLCGTINGDIEALQDLIDALQSKDFVTSVEPVIENGKGTGFLITFQSGKTVVVSHGRDGQNGADGQDGQDGYTPQIGIEKGSDGCYYWTLDGKWILDDSGDKIPAEGQDGKDGAQGQPGQDGKEGVTPELKIGEDGNWYVSVDGGQSWKPLGPSVGTPGSDGENGGSLFSDVEVREDGLHVTLSNGTELIIPMSDSIQTSIISSIQLLMPGKEMNYRKSGTDDDPNIIMEAVVSPASAVSELESIYKSVFHLNLSRVDVASDKDRVSLSPIMATTDKNTGCISLEFDLHEVPEAYFDVHDVLRSDRQTIQGWLVYDDGVKVLQTLSNYFILSRNNPRIYYYSSKKIDASAEKAFGEHLVYSAYYPENEVGVLNFPNDFRILPSGIQDSDIHTAKLIYIDSLATGAFSGFSNIREVNFDSCEPKWGEGVFEGCTQLERLVLWNGDFPDELPDRSFKGCTSLVDMPYPNLGVGKECFYGCKNMLSPDYYMFLYYIGEHAFYGCTSLTNFMFNALDNDKRDIVVEKGAFEGCTSMTSFLFFGNDVPHTNLVIEKDAFNGCTALSYLSVDGNQVVLKEGAMHGCPNINFFYPEAGIERIEKNAFDFDLLSANEITSIAEYVTGEICDEVFAGYTLRQYMSLNTRKIGRRAFYNCPGLTSLNLETGIEEIGDEAFAGSAVDDISTYDLEPPVLGTGVFDMIPNLRIWCSGTPNYTAYINAPGWSLYKDYIVKN